MPLYYSYDYNNKRISLNINRKILQYYSKTFPVGFIDNINNKK